MSNTILKAWLEARKEIPNVIRGRTNPHFRNDYASIDDILDVVQPILLKHGLILTQEVDGNGTHMGVRTTLYHPESGDHISTNDTNGALVFNVGNLDAQKVCGAITYLRRYTLLTFLGLPAEDDDGNTATGKTTPSKPAPARKQAPVPNGSSQPPTEAGPDWMGKMLKAMVNTYYQDRADAIHQEWCQAAGVESFMELSKEQMTKALGMVESRMREAIVAAFGDQEEADHAAYTSSSEYVNKTGKGKVANNLAELNGWGLNTLYGNVISEPDPELWR